MSRTTTILRSFAASMSKLSTCTILLALAALVAACSSPTPTPVPTTTPVPPAPTATPTSVPAPTATPRPTATPGPTEETPKLTLGSGALAPIGTNDPQAFMSELSAAEQSCLAGNVDPQQVMALLGGAPGLVSPEETTALIQCLEDETLLRLFLTGLIGQTEPLSAESSVCVRSGFANFDVRSVMLATPVESDAAAAMAGSMAGFLVTLSCLNDEEWQVVGPSVGMGTEDRDGLRCVLAELGGPEGLAAALQPGAGPPTAFFEASAACNLQMTQGESGTVAPTPAPSAILLSIVVASVPGAIPEYDRDEWRHWTDEDGDCQDARQEVLVAESVSPIAYEDAGQCRVASGAWVGPYMGEQFDDPGRLDVDHMVPLGNAHQSGGWAWSAPEKRQYANDLSYENHLIAVQASANRSKGSKSPADWRPPDRGYWCQYAVEWIAIKTTWELTATEPEAEALGEMLGTCAPARTLTVVRVDPVETTEPTPPQSPGTASPSPAPASAYATCDDAVEVGEPRIQGGSGSGRGFPAAKVPSARDGDGDGVVCER